MADIVLRRAPYAGGPVNVVLGGDDAPVDAPPSWVTGSVSLSGPVAAGFVRYDNAVPKRVEALCAAPWALARRAERDLSAPWTLAETREAQTDAVWREARDASAQVSLDWAACDRLSQAVQIAWGTGQRAAREIALRHLVCERARLDVGLAWASGRSLHVQASTEWARPRGLRSEIEVSAQIARRMLVTAGTGWSAGRSVGIGAFLVPWRYTRPLRHGADTWVRPGPVTPDTHTPDLQIVLRCPVWAGGAVNVLLGRVCNAPEPPAFIVIPVRRSYMVHNSVTLYRLPSGAEFEAKSFSLDLDADSWTFGWSASLHSSAAAHMTRSPSGERVEVECVVNGVHLRLVVDGKGPDRRFPEHRIQVRGRGRAAELADPSLTFGNTAARTAQQLMADVLTVNGVSMGWGIDWGIEDWLVPADAWVFSGSYIDALRDIAGAAGAYLQPHLTDQVIRVLPLYPLAPWHWANLAVDVELPVEATSVEGIEEVIRPDYNQVHLGGMKAPAVFGPFKRTGTAGDKEAPQVNHALITAAEVHRQRGQAILSDTGLQEHVSISTMLWPETGIIMPGTVLRYVSDDGPRTGIVRKTGLSMQQWPQLVQTLGVETHVE